MSLFGAALPLSVPHLIAFLWLHPGDLSTENLVCVCVCVPYIFHQSDFCDCLSVCVPVYVGQSHATGKILSLNIE